jgi:PPM family protein phosphatase
LKGFFKKIFKKQDHAQQSNEDFHLLNQISEEIIANEDLQNDLLEDHMNMDTEEGVPAKEQVNFSRYSFFASSHTGKVKQLNEDSLFSSEVKIFSKGHLMHFGMAAVADGMGGLSMGELASSKVITSMNTFMHARISEYTHEGSVDGKRILEDLKMGIKNANDLLYQLGLEKGTSMGSTLTFLFLSENEAYVGHVGDSRGYVFNPSENCLQKITRDHSLVGRLVEMDHITDKEAKNHPRRNEIYRMMGLKEKISVEISCRKINHNESILLMSDGLWEAVDDEEIQKELQNNKDMQNALDTLVELANEKGGHDNISIMLIKPE